MSSLFLVEDNADDAYLLTRALRRKHPDLVIELAPDGAEALDRLFPAEPARQGLRPDLICLDLNLPKVSGYEVLSRIKGCADMAGVPVMVSSTTTDPREIEQCYALGADLFVQKTVGFSEFQCMMDEIIQYWRQHRCLPPRSF